MSFFALAFIAFLQSNLLKNLLAHDAILGFKQPLQVFL